MFKKIISLLLAILSILMFSACGGDEPTTDGTTEAPANDAVETTAEETTAAPVPGVGVVNECSVEILDMVKTVNYNDEDTVIIPVKFTNNGTKADAFATTCSLTAYQDGVEMSDAFSVDGVDSNVMTKIQPGNSLIIYKMFLLNGEADVEVQITEYIAIDEPEYLVEKTFAVADALSIDKLPVLDNSNASDAPADSSNYIDSKGTLGDFDVEIVSAEKGKNYDDSDAAIITVKWTNNSDEPAAFIYELNLTAYQNGVEMTDAMMVDGVDSQASMNKIQPGKTVELKDAFVISGDSDIEVHITEAVSFDDNPTEIVKTFSVSELS